MKLWIMRCSKMYNLPSLVRVHSTNQPLLASIFQLVNEYLADPRVHEPPQTFHMDGLLQEMKDIEQHHLQQRAPIRGLKTCV